MPKRVIDFYDSVQFTGEWSFVKEKKEKLKVKAEKVMNSEIYMTFNQVVPLYTFLYFALAPQEAFDFQKVQPILDQMRSTHQQKQKFEVCKRSISLHWDGVTPLPSLIRNHKKHIIREQKNIYDLSQKITEDQVKQLLKSGLSQRKIHLDYHTSDGAQQEAIIPSIQNIDNCISIIYDQTKKRYLLAFFCHIEENNNQKIQESIKKINQVFQQHNKPHNFTDRPLPTKPIFNPDDRPLPNPQNHPQSHSIHTRKIINPDERLLPKPQSHYYNRSHEIQMPKPLPTYARHILNPDQKLLLPPPMYEPQQFKEGRKAMRQNPQFKNRPKSFEKKKKVNEATNQLKREVEHISHIAQDKFHEMEQNAKNFGMKVEHRVQQIVDNLKHEKPNWVKLGVSALIVGMFIKTLRA